MVHQFDNGMMDFPDDKQDDDIDFIQPIVDRGSPMEFSNDRNQGVKPHAFDIKVNLEIDEEKPPVDETKNENEQISKINDRAYHDII